MIKNAYPLIFAAVFYYHGRHEKLRVFTDERKFNTFLIRLNTPARIVNKDGVQVGHVFAAEVGGGIAYGWRYNQEALYL